MANAGTENVMDFSSFGTKVEPTAEPLDFSSFGTKVEPTAEPLDFSSFGTKVEPTAEPLDFSSFGTKVNNGLDQPTVDKTKTTSERGFIGRRVDDARRGFNRFQQGQGTIDAENAVRRIQEFDQIDDGTFDPSNYYDRELWMYKSGDEAMRAKLRQSQQSVMSESFGRISDAENTISQLPQSEAVQKFGGAETFGDAWDALVESPVEVISSLATESLGQQSPTLPLIALNPALGAGAGSFATEYGADIVNSLRESGVDFSSKENISAGLSDPEKMAAFKEHALKRGLAIGLVDAISGGLAGKFAAGAKSTLGKIGRGVAEDLVMQPALGAAGEVAGAVAAGDEISGKDILAEAVGEIGPGAVQTAIGTVRYGRAMATETPFTGDELTDTADTNAETLYLPAPEAEVADQTDEVLALPPSDMTYGDGFVMGDFAEPSPQEQGQIGYERKLALPPSETTYGDGFTMNEPTPDVVTTTPELPSPEQYGRMYGDGFAAGTDLLPPSPGPNYVAMVDRAGRQAGWYDPTTAHAVGKELGSFEAARRPAKSIDDIMNDGRNADEIRAELVAQRQNERANADVGSVVKAKLPGQSRAQEVRVVGFTPEGAVVETRAGDKVRLGDDQIILPDQLSFDLEQATPQDPQPTVQQDVTVQPAAVTEPVSNVDMLPPADNEASGAKSASRGEISLSRRGDFYEVRGDQAKAVADALDLAVTEQNGIPLVGFPVYRRDDYFKKLEDAGFNISDDSTTAKKRGPAKKEERVSFTRQGDFYYLQGPQASRVAKALKSSAVTRGGQKLFKFPYYSKNAVFSELRNAGFIVDEEQKPSGTFDGSDQRILYSMRKHPARLISVSGTEMGQWKTTGQLRRKAAKHLQDLRGTTIKNADTGLELRITDRGIKHTLSGAGPELLQAVGKIKDIIRVATHIAVEADKRGRPEVKAVHKFETDININDQKFIAHITGYEITDGAIFYDMALGRRGKGASASGTEINDQVRNRITGQTPRNQNIEPKNKKIQSEARAQLEADVIAEIKRLAPAAKVETRDNGKTLVGGTMAEGGYIPVDDLIWTAMDASNPEHVARHEVFHHLRATGRITDTEWSILQRKAKSTWRDKYQVNEYRDQYAGQADIETILDEEAVAEAYADWVDGRGDAKGGVARIFRKIRDFFERIASVVRGHGFKSAADVFSSIDAGEVGRRAAKNEREMKQQRAEYFSIFRRAKPSNLTPDQEAAIKRSMENIEDEQPFGLDIRETISDVSEYLESDSIQHIFDQFNSIKRYEKATYGELKRASMSAYKMARLTTNLKSTMAAVLRHGPLEYKNGAFQVRSGFDGGFEAIFTDLADRGLLKAWKGWAAANRAERLAGEGRENNMTAADIATLKDLDKQHPEFRAVLKRWTAFNAAMLDMAEQTGLLDPDARTLFESDDYVPFYRVLDDQPTGPFSKRGLANQRSGINRLRGGDAQVNDLIDNMVRNMTHLVDASMKNVAAKRVFKTIKTAGLDDGSVIMKVPHDVVPVNITPEQAAQALENIGVQVQGMTRQQHDQWLKLFTLRPPKDPDVVSVMVGGKPQYFRVNDPLLLSSLTSLGEERVHWLVSMLGFPKRALTAGITAFPGFISANFIRDSGSAWVTTSAKFIPGFDSFRGAIKSFREDTALVNIMAAGGGSGGFFSTRSRDVATDMARRGSTVNTTIDTPKKMWHWYHKIGQASENSNRIAIYESVLKETGDVAEAAYQALDIMDFTMRGDSSVIRFLIQTIPFLNARMQGLYRLGRGAKENPKSFILRGGLLMGASLALYAMNKDDDRYNDMDEWKKDTYYHIFLDKFFPKQALLDAGISPDQFHLKIPKPFEVGALFSTIPERVIRMAEGKDDVDKFADRMTAMLRSTFAVDMPQFAKPLAEQWANEITFTGAPIVSERLKDLKPEAQYDGGTSELAKQIGKALPDVFGQAKSPKRIEAAARAYFGTFGAYVMAIADEALDPIVGNPVEPETRADQIPELGRFIEIEPYRTTRFLSEFYDLKNEVNALAQTYKQYRNQGQVEDAKALATEEPKKLAIASFMRRKARQMSGINKNIRSIEESRSLSAHEKRTQIDQLMETRNKLAKQVMQSLSKNGIK